jgi:flagella synthesis protein FlgN
MIGNDMPATTTGAQQVIDFLERQIPQLSGMLQALQEEHQALASNDLPAFEIALQKKQAHAHALEKLEDYLTPLSQIIGGDVSRSGLDKFINALSDAAVRDQVQTRWDQFSKMLGECHEQNQLNHRVIEASRIQLQQALDILRGESGAPQLYGASGKQAENKQRQSIAVA